MSVGEYATLAHAEIDGLVAQTGCAVVAGGTGLYLRAALVDLDIPPAVTPATRARLEARYDADPDAAYARLLELDPAAVVPSTATTVAASSVRSSSPRRAPRSSPRRTGSGRRILRRTTLVVGLDVPSDELERRITDRTAGMVERGVAEEVARGREVARLGDRG